MITTTRFAAIEPETSTVLESGDDEYEIEAFAESVDAEFHRQTVDSDGIVLTSVLIKDFYTDSRKHDFDD